MALIRRRYRIPAKRGMQVLVHRRPGRITGSDGDRLRIRLAGDKTSTLHHPTWRLRYPGWSRWEQQYTRDVVTLPVPGVSW